MSTAASYRLIARPTCARASIRAGSGRWGPMDGFLAVRARIASIEQRFQPPTPVLPSGASAFTSILDQAMGTTSASATQRAPGAYGPAQVPAELMTFGNGKIPRSALSEIGIGNHRLSSRAAGAFRDMRAAAARDGVEIGVTDSYRTYDQQVDLAERKGLYSEGGLAARPGTSNHGWGLAIDVDVNSRGQQWLSANAARYGFVEDVPREPWHWTFRPDSGV